MKLTDDMRQALQFLSEVNDIEDFAAKINRGGFLRTAARSHIERLFNLSARESEEVCDSFVLSQQR